MRLALYGTTVLYAAWPVDSSRFANFVNTRTNVDHIADIVLDVRDMEENCRRNDKIAAETIYIVGKNSPYGDKPGLRSLQQFGQGISGPNSTHVHPTFAYQMYGLTDGDLSRVPEKPVSQFMDDYIMKAFNADECDRAVQGAQVMTLWMQSAHVLWDGLLVCDADSKTGVEGGLINTDKHRANADSFIATWMGSLQSKLDSTDGYSPYSMTQRASVLFGGDFIAHVNVEVMEAYEDLSASLSLFDACTPRSDITPKYWKINSRLVNLMLIPQMQLLIDALYTGDQDLITLYGSIVVPQLSQCRHSTYTYLKKEILEGTNDSREFSKIYYALTSTLECLDISCEALGTYSKDNSIKCDGDGAARLMAKYPPKTSIRQVAKVDIDMHQMKLLMSFDSDTAWDMAMNIYKYGKNSDIIDFTNDVIKPAISELNDNDDDDDDEDDDFDDDGEGKNEYDDDEEDDDFADDDEDDDEEDDDDFGDDDFGDDDDNFDDDEDDDEGDDDYDDDEQDDDDRFDKVSNDGDDDYDDDGVERDDDDYDDDDEDDDDEDEDDNYDDDDYALDDDTMDDNFDDDDNNDDDDDSDDDFSSNRNYNSLQTMATTEKRFDAEFFPTYKEYFNNNGNYADTLIMDTFTGAGYWGTKTKEVKAAIISTTLQTSVMWMYTIAEMADAIADCVEKRSFKTIESHEWDEVAALIIGSLEGRTEGGSDDIKDGQLLWNLGNMRAFEFGRANKKGYAKSNQKVLNLLFSGKGQIETTSCTSLRETVRRLEHLLLIPVMQSVIEYARLNESRPSMGTSKEIAMGEAYANAVLPMVKLYSKPAADVIAKNMLVNGVGTMVPDGAQAVADAVNVVVREFGVECQVIGKRFDIDTCKNFIPNIQQEKDNNAVHTNVWMACTVLALSSFMIML